MKPLFTAFDHPVAKPPRVSSKDKLKWLSDDVLELKAVREDYIIEFQFFGPKDVRFVGRIHSASLDNAIIRAMHGIFHPQRWDWSNFWTVEPEKNWKPLIVDPQECFNPLGLLPCGCGGYYRYLNEP